MTETHGTDTVNETITVKGLAFSSQLTIGAAKWLEQTTGKPLTQAFTSLLPEGEDAAKEFSVAKLSLLVQALYMAAHPGVDPKTAEAAVDALTIADLFDVFNRAHPMEFEPKNSQGQAVTESRAESTGQPSSTT